MAYPVERGFDGACQEGGSTRYPYHDSGGQGRQAYSVLPKHGTVGKSHRLKPFFPLGGALSDCLGDVFYPQIPVRPFCGNQRQNLRAAQKLFALRGFNGVTMRAVASEAGVNLASIVYYFENKEGLYLAVYRQYAEPLMKARMKMLKEADLHPSLRAYARAFIEPAFRLFLDESLGGPDHVRLLWRLPQEPEYLGRKIYDEFYAPSIQEMIARIRRFCPWDDELSLSWHAHIMSSIFHATLGKYVACMDLQEKEPWMKDQEHILQMIVNTAVFLISRPALSPEEEERQG